MSQRYLLNLLPAITFVFCKNSKKVSQKQAEVFLFTSACQFFLENLDVFSLVAVRSIVADLHAVGIVDHYSVTNPSGIND